jgi:hypothetical protein
VEFELFHRPDFVAVLESVYDLEDVPGLSRILDGETPFLRSRKPFKGGAVFSLPLGFYQTADYFRRRWRGDEWPRLQAWAREHRANVTFTTVGALNLEPAVLRARNPVLALGGDPAAGYSRNLRLNLRKEWNKAQRHGVVVEASLDRADLRAFYRLLATQYVREHRMLFQPYALFERLLGPEGPGRLVVARHGGRVAAGLYLLADGAVLHYNWGARGTVENVSLGTLLLDHAVRAAQAEGFEAFDFGSTPLSDTALLDYKMRWGCTDHPVLRHYTTAAPMELDLNASFTGPRALYARLPVGLAMRIMPGVVPWLVS